MWAIRRMERTIVARQDILTGTLFNQAMSKSIGKTQAKAYTQSMKMSALPYNGKRSVTTIRTTPPEIRVSARSQAATIIGPVQKIRKPTLSDERSVSQVVAAVPSTVESLLCSEVSPCWFELIPECSATAGQRVPPYEADGDAGAAWRKLWKRMSRRTS